MYIIIVDLSLKRYNCVSDNAYHKRRGGIQYIPEERDEDPGEGDFVARLSGEQWDGGHDHDKDT